jgi:hypothetical protein
MSRRSLRFDTDALASALSDARDTTSDQARMLFRSAVDSMSDGSRTAKKRVNRAVDALAGRPAAPRWGQIALFTGLGLATGAVAAMAARQAVARRMALTEDQADELAALEQARMESRMVP